MKLESKQKNILGKNREVIFIGMNPGVKKLGKRNAAITRLYSWFRSLELPIVTFINLSWDPKWDGRFESIDRDFVINSSRSFRRVVALGKKVSSTLLRLEIDHYVLPHPSFSNRQFNQDGFEIKVLEECRKYIYD